MKKRTKVSYILKVGQYLLKDPRTPRPARLLLYVAIGYALMPIDIIPDFIPVLGQLDDVILIPALLFIAFLMISKEIREDAQKKAKDDTILLAREPDRTVAPRW
ncbi:MAG TPA: YkvA family protein [Candidatus Kapabacteria bacterium]|nr:YkvA family protein [Candidatus Kapabacteria bacterium]